MSSRDVDDFLAECRIDGCEKPSKWAGSPCSMHYARMSRNGTYDLPSRAEGAAQTLRRFWAKVDGGAVSECWRWAASTTRGYGVFRLPKPDGRLVYAHRFAYESARGPIPDGLQIDHLCREPLCVNPSHLEPVTPDENIRRGIQGFTTSNTCKAGKHDIDNPANVYTYPNGERCCRPCNREAVRRYRARKRMESGK